MSGGAEFVRPLLADARAMPGVAPLWHNSFPRAAPVKAGGDSPCSSSMSDRRPVVDNATTFAATDHMRRPLPAASEDHGAATTMAWFGPAPVLTSRKFVPRNAFGAGRKHGVPDRPSVNNLAIDKHAPTILAVHSLRIKHRQKSCATTIDGLMGGTRVARY